MRLVYSIRPEPDAAPDDAAATWFSLLLSGDASEADHEAIKAWRAESPENAEAWSKVVTIWDYSPIESNTTSILAIREEALARAAPSKRRRTWIPAAIAASLAVAIVGAGIYVGGFIPDASLGSGGSVQIASAAREIHTAVGEQQRVVLEDGSRVTVNTASAVRVAFSATARNVDLTSGEAFFRVAKNPQRPFVVSASGVSVTAVGTQFSVRMMDGEVDVVLAEGRVNVTRGEGATAQSATLNPGERLRATSTGFVVSPVDASKATSWTAGSVSFEQTPLRTAIAEMNRYSAHPIVLSSPALDSIPITGQFPISKPGRLVSVLTEAGVVRSIPRPDGSVELQAAHSAP